jgi:uncharacterized protein YhbP (UPF0306 family)
MELTRNLEICPENAPRLALALIATQAAMTLATAVDNQPWAAAVYYVFQQGRFYFFSDPTSRHIRQALVNGQAAGAISVSATSWEEIRGIQMGGYIAPMNAGPRVLSVIAAYLEKYPFTRELIPHKSPLEPDTFFKRFRARLYFFHPLQAYYLDNRIRFGFREPVSLTPHGDGI